MINLTELIRGQQGLLSKDGLAFTFLYPDAYMAVSLKDFLEDRKMINCSWKSRIKIDYKHTLSASVCIRSCKYQANNEAEEIPTPEKWRTLESEIHLNERMRSLKENTPVNFKQAEIEFLNRFKNGELYDATSRYSIMARIPVPSGITIYNVWLKYVPSSDLAEIDSFDHHDTVKITDRSAHTSRIRYLLPILQPA